MSAPVVVVTGSTRGIGFHLASAFLQRGAKVVISGRTDTAVTKAVDALSGSVPGDVAGFSCDVTVAEQVEALLRSSEDRFGPVDIWINNAGTCNRIRPFEELSANELADVVNINIRGAQNGTLVALRA